VDTKKMVLPVTDTEAELLSALVDGELNRICAAIDDTIVRAYDVVPAKHTEKAIAEIKKAILGLVRSPLAELERKLAICEPEPEPEVKPEPEPEPEVKPEPEPEPEKEPAKAKA